MSVRAIVFSDFLKFCHSILVLNSGFVIEILHYEYFYDRIIQKAATSTSLSIDRSLMLYSLPLRMGYLTLEKIL